MSRIFHPGIYIHYCYLWFLQLIVQWTIILKSMSLDEFGGNHLCFWNTINTTQFQRVSAWQVLDMFGRLLERPLIAADAHTRYRMLIKMFDKQLECCKMIFKQQMQTGETQGSVFTNNITRLFAINLGFWLDICCLLVFQVTLLSPRTCLWLPEVWNLSNNCRNAYRSLTITSDSSTTRKYLILGVWWKGMFRTASVLNNHFICVIIDVWSLRMERR